MFYKSRFLLLGTACLSALFAYITFAANQTTPGENSLPYLSGPVDQANMIAPSHANDPKTTTYILPATPATTQWGFFDSSVKPVLNIKSGDTIVIETMAASDNQVVPG